MAGRLARLNAELDDWLSESAGRMAPVSMIAVAMPSTPRRNGEASSLRRG